MNETKKELVKAVASSVAAFAGSPVAATIAASLGVAIEMFGALSQKRSSELFNSDEYVHKVVSKIEESDDFASFVYDIWLKHNFESSEQRRKYLRNMLKKETYDSTNHFVNFSKIEHILQNASIESLRLATYIYSKDFSEREYNSQDAGTKLVNYQKLASLLEGTKYDDLRIDIELYVNELSALGIINLRHNRYGGPFIDPTSFGSIVVEYIKEECVKPMVIE